MKSFKDYQGASEEETLQKIAAETASAESASAAADLTKKIASAYRGKSNGEMLASILKQAEESKKNGTLSNEEIDEFYRQFSPMLDAFQRRRLKVIIDKLKAIP
ncbi:MAG: hypothetical protein IJV80_02050 [Clostridia bacterium]|nr:hypothetical protein [Clostridia bacterium]